jgi:hypothetical protein
MNAHFYKSMRDPDALAAISVTSISAKAVLEDSATLTTVMHFNIDTASVVVAAASSVPCTQLHERIALLEPDLFIVLSNTTGGIKHALKQLLETENLTTLQSELQSCGQELEAAERCAPIFAALAKTQPIITAAFSHELSPTSPYSAHLIRALNKRHGGYNMLPHLVDSHGACIETVEASPLWRCERALMGAYPACDLLLAEYVVTACCRMDAERGVPSCRSHGWAFARKVHFACCGALLYGIENSVEEIVDTFTNLGAEGMVDDVVSVGDEAARLLAANTVAAIARTLAAVDEGVLEEGASFASRVAALVPAASLDSSAEEVLEIYDALSVDGVAEMCDASIEDAWAIVGLARSQQAMDTDLESDELCAVVSLWDGLGCVLPPLVALLRSVGGSGGCAAGVVANAAQLRDAFLQLHGHEAATVEFKRRVGQLYGRVQEVARALAPPPSPCDVDTTASETLPAEADAPTTQEVDEDVSPAEPIVTAPDALTAEPTPQEVVATSTTAASVEELHEMPLSALEARIAALTALSSVELAAYEDAIRLRFPMFPRGASMGDRKVVIAIRSHVKRLTAEAAACEVAGAVAGDAAAPVITAPSGSNPSAVVMAVDAMEESPNEASCVSVVLGTMETSQSPRDETASDVLEEESNALLMSMAETFAEQVTPLSAQQRAALDDAINFWFPDFPEGATAEQLRAVEVIRHHAKRLVDGGTSTNAAVPDPSIASSTESGDTTCQSASPASAERATKVMHDSVASSDTDAVGDIGTVTHPAEAEGAAHDTNTTPPSVPRGDDVLCPDRDQVEDAFDASPVDVNAFHPTDAELEHRSSCSMAPAEAQRTTIEWSATQRNEPNNSEDRSAVVDQARHGTKDDEAPASADNRAVSDLVKKSAVDAAQGQVVASHAPTLADAGADSVGDEITVPLRSPSNGAALAAAADVNSSTRADRGTQPEARPKTAESSCCCTIM